MTTREFSTGCKNLTVNLNETSISGLHESTQINSARLSDQTKTVRNNKINDVL